ncbi:S8 family peptidase [Gelidibacter sp. F63206]|uniref:S8 family peptidase n=1 Tax=Gelidibacter sp. F63206 TaxID=2926425 RepID=UPI001FF51A08|nr:S8 family peptidase [Gelidibacter sp. F63206]MCK0114817.1 S8 family peptidase [Gelidibacter sp. F63206]
MKIFRISYIIILVTILLTSCGSVKAVLPQHINTITTTIVAKKEVLTELELQDWPYADIFTDTIPGISLVKTYEFLKDKKASPIIVGIIDSGVDIEHKDLNQFIWKNENEIANNQMDDDHNGFVDDIHGWNFLGSNQGNIYHTQLEITRMIKKYEAKTLDEIIETSQEDYDLFQDQREEYNQTSISVNMAIESLIQKLNTTPNDDKLKDALAYYENLQKFHYNLDINPRKIVGDDPNDLLDTGYGNADVTGFKDKGLHGTHVSGIVAAVINKSIGLGSNLLKIMPIRAIPDGDEYDKDVALAIRYAVDNGAKVINMSFGKAYSAHPNWVYEAIEYAKKNDVLLIMGAGNNGKNIDTTANFPNDTKNSDVEFTDNMICVGATTHNFNISLVSVFSNYGKKNVDIFAPGSKIYSTIPDNEYAFQDGTSMSAPMVSGVAALIRSYYPKLSAIQVKRIIMDSGISVDFEVNVGRFGNKKLLNELSVTGKILNAYNAILMADNLSIANK